MKLIPEWRRSWRMFSVQALAVIAAAPLVWAELPDDAKASVTALVPTEWLPFITTGVALAGIIGRLVDQGVKR